MEPSGPTGGKRWQMGRARKPLKRADRQSVATHGNDFGVHGKEGVDGSSPSEGSARSPQVGWFVFMSTCRFSRVRWVWSHSWSLQVEDAPRTASPACATSRRAVLLGFNTGPV
jgi:hypothetical protein